EAAIVNAHVESRCVRQQIIEPGKHKQEARIACAQSQDVRARRDARVLAARLLAISGDYSRDKSPVAVCLIRVWKIRRRQRIVEADADALRVCELHVL